MYVTSTAGSVLFRWVHVHSFRRIIVHFSIRTWESWEHVSSLIRESWVLLVWLTFGAEVPVYTLYTLYASLSFLSHILLSPLAPVLICLSLLLCSLSSFTTLLYIPSPLSLLPSHVPLQTALTSNPYVYCDNRCSPTLWADRGIWRICSTLS